MMNRFADIDLSFKRLPPVYGYRSQKLVPIEKALEPFQSEIDELPYYIKTAKQYCHFPSEHGLTHDESAAIYIYTMEWGDSSLYRILNKALRSENRQTLKIWFPYLKLFDTALDKLPTVKEVVWRGVDADIGKHFTKNQLVTWWSVNSCSSSVNVIKDFLANDKNSTLFLIEAVNGKKIVGYTEYTNEDEIILRIGTQFRVKCDALEQPNGSRIVHLIEVDNNDNKALTSAMNEMHLATTPSNKTTLGRPQKLNKQLDKVEVNRDLVQQTLTEKAAESQKYVSKLIQQIEKWECDSIEKIQRTAEEARQILLKHTGEHITQIEDQINKLIGQLRQYSQENNFVETDLQKWDQEAIQLSNQLVKISNITIREDSTPLVTTIQVNICDSLISKPNIHQNTIWMQNGFTVAGGNGKGRALNQLDCPFSIYVDYDQTVYVADLENDRIVEWRCGVTSGQIVGSSNKKGNEMTQLNHPIGMIIDKERNNLIICDQGNRRIVRWPRQNGTTEQTIISNIDCCRLAMDNNGYLYVSDYKRHEVRRWKMDGTCGTVVAGGNGKGSRLNQLNCPTFIFVDEDHSVYVSDRNNHRVMKWMEGAKEGIVAAGFKGQGNGLTQLSRPEGLIVDHLGTVYVADYDNHRIMRWCKGATHGNIVVGEHGQGKQANQLTYPTDLSFDRQGNLYVTDFANHRVQRFNIDGN